MARNPSISLTEHQLRFVSQLVESGRYHGVSEVMRAGLRLLEEQETRRATARQALEDAIKEGLASGDASPLEPIDALIAKAETELPESRG